MNVLVCIDDTDSLVSRGTGELAAVLAREVETKGWGLCSSITRHQLFVHPDIPYTSHNSSMCFSATIEEGCLDRLTELASGFLARESAEGSDPGLCIAVVGRLRQPDRLIEFGYRAKKAVVEMKDAYGLAEEQGVHLSSHGGTGQGIIGALAGVGLRLGGNDGRMRGSIQMPGAKSLVPVRDILSHPGVDAVRTMEGVLPDDSDMVRLVDKVKTVLLGGSLALLVVPDEDENGTSRWRNCTRQQLKGY